MRDDAKEALVSLLTLAALIVAGLLSKRDRDIT